MSKFFKALAPIILSIPFLAAQPVVPTQEVLFPHLVVGGGWECEITLVTQGAETSTGRIIFTAQDGGPLNVSINGGAPTDVLDYEIPFRRSVTYQLTGDDSTQIGFALITQEFSLDNPNRGSVNGLLTFRFRSGGTVVQQIGVAGAQSISRAHVPFDNTQNNRTAVAIASLEENSIQLTWWDENGNQVETKTLEFGAFEQRSVFLHDEFPAALGQRGFVTLEGPTEFHMLVLNQDVEALLLSTSVAMPGVLERVVEIAIPSGETSQWVLRLVQDGFFLYGSADEIGGDPTFASGILTEGFFQLNIHLVSQTDQSLVITLLDSEAPDSFDGFSGSATQLQEDGAVSETGTFEVTRPGNAQF